MVPSSGSNQLQKHSCSEGDPLTAIEQRKQKRMMSNRESARRSRMRKQKHLDELMARVSYLRKENSQILTALNVVTQHFFGVEAENSVLRTQMVELRTRLQSLDEILSLMSSGGGAGLAAVEDGSFLWPWTPLFSASALSASHESYVLY